MVMCLDSEASTFSWGAKRARISELLGQKVALLMELMMFSVIAVVVVTQDSMVWVLLSYQSY